MSDGWRRIFGGVPEEEVLNSAFRFALSLCRNAHDAEDLVQEASLRLCRRYGFIQNHKIMFTTIRHLFYDLRRRDKIVPFQSIEDSPRRDVADDTSLEHLLIADLESALGELTADERELVYLSKVEGYSASEIALVTGQPRSTILWRLGRAIKKLRNYGRRERTSHQR